MKSSTKLRLVLGASFFALAGSLALTGTAYAASDTATLQGHAAPGSSVSATDTVTGQTVTVKADANGNYVIVGLRPSSYHVVSGSTTEDVTLPVGETVTLDLAADASTTTVTVVGRRSKEVRTSEINTSVSQRQIENLPQNDRNFLNFAALAPGVNVSQGNKTFYAGGVGPDQVNVFIDGQSYKNQSSHGGVAGQSFTPGNPFPQLAVQEFKVASQNFKAEYEQSGSAIITAVTKTGGSEFHGDVFAELTNKDMYGQPFFDRSNPKPDYKRYQYGADIGGPIIKNVLHFYAAGEWNDTTRPTTAVNLPSQVPSSIRNVENGDFATPFKQTLLFGKLTWYANDADTVNVSAFSRKEDNNIDFGGNKTKSEARNVRANTTEGMVEWNHRGDGFLNEASLAYQDAEIGTPDLTHGPRLVLSNGVGGGDLALMGAQEFEQNSGQKIWTFRDNVTFTSFDWHGSHVIKTGFKYAATKLSRQEANQMNGSYYYDAASYTGTSTDPGTSIPWQATINLLPPTTFRAANNQIGAFIQDDWTLDSHWTFNLGIRWDYESNMMNNKFVTPQAIVNALASYTNWTAAGIDYHNYVSNGHNRKAFTGAFAPRLGFSYDVNGDRDFVIFGGWGRYYDRDVFLSGQIESVKDIASAITTRQFCGAAGLPTCSGSMVQWQASYKDPNALRAALAGSGGDVWLLNNDTKVPYSDNLDLGVRKRFGDVNFTLSVQHNMSYNIFTYVRGNRMPDGSFSPMGDGYIIDNFPDSGQLPGYHGKLNIGDSNTKSRYNAIFVTVDKPFTAGSKYGYTASLTLADSKSNGGEVGADEFFQGGNVNVFGYHHTLGVDKFHFVGTGIIAGPWDTTISGTVTLGSGMPFGAINAQGPNPPNACCIYIPQGVYFPRDKMAFQQVDLRIAKDFTLWNGQTITIDGQVYNLFDHVNRAYSAWGAGANWGGGAPLKENSTTGVARTFQVGLKYKF